MRTPLRSTQASVLLLAGFVTALAIARAGGVSAAGESLRAAIFAQPAVTAPVLNATAPAMVEPVAVAAQSGQTPGQLAVAAARTKLDQARQAYAANPTKSTQTALEAAQTEYNQAVALRTGEIRARLKQIFGATGFNKKGQGTGNKPSDQLLAEARALTAELRSYDPPAAQRPNLVACPTNSTLTHSSSQTITPLNSVSCNAGGLHSDNSYWRAFNLTALGVIGGFNVTSVEIGVEAAGSSGGTQPITVRIHQQTSGVFPSGTRTLLSSANFSVPDSATGTVISIPIVAAVPAGSEMVVEIFTPDGQAAGNSFFIGSNASGQSGPSYISTAACGVTDPTDLALVDFPDMHIVMNVIGCDTVGGEPTPSPTPCPATTTSYTGPAAAIPDNNPTGVTVTLPVAGVVGPINDLNFRFDTAGACDTTGGNTNAAVDHTWIGDLIFTLTSPGGTSVTFIDRIGVPAGNFGNSNNNFCLATIDDEATNLIENFTGGPVAGNFKPNNPFSAFDGQNANGNWTLKVVDAAGGDTGALRRFSLIIEACPPVPCVITCPTNITVPNDPGQCLAVVNYPAPTTTGPCNTITCTPGSGAAFPVGVTTVTCGEDIIIDRPNRPAATCSFTITVQDTQPPALMCPANVTVPNTAGACSAVVSYTTPTATDNCPGATVACVPASGATFPVGITTVTCTASDASPNSADTTCTFTVTVQDTQAPTVACPANMTVPNTAGACNAVVSYTVPTATDNCPGATVTCVPASGATFPVGTTTVTCTASDTSPNSPDTTCTFTVTVQDTQAPAVTCPANMTVPNTAGACNAAVSYTAPTATDNCPGATVTCVPASGATYPVGTTTVTCTASDASPNSPDTTCRFTITVQDTQAPVLSACPANQTIPSVPNGSATAATYTPPTATDNCPGVTVVCAPASGSAFAVGTTTVTCTASDASPNSPDATCSFTITVTAFIPMPTMSLLDPLDCTGPGDVVNGSVSLTNSTASPQTGTVTVALPAGIVGIPGTCVSNIATCTVTATTVTWTGTIPANSALTFSYNGQIAAGVAAGTQLCAMTTAVFGNQTGTVQACLTVNCPQAGPGIPNGTAPVSDQKPGSVLFYNLVSSSATNAATQNSRISITNTDTTRTAFVHLFFVDGSSCAVADSFICLTPNQTATVLHSDLDPGTTGYIVAVATDRTGCPINFNYLIGDEYVKLSSGHAANLAAESIAARAGGATFCAPTASDAVLAFNDVAYDAMPRVLALDNFASPNDGNQTLLVVNRVGGYLSTGAFTLGTLFGILYDDAEQALSFSIAGTCQLRANLNGSTIRTAPRVEQFIPTGRTGWLKLFSQADIGILGASLTFNANATTQTGAFNQGHNLHKLRLSQAAVYTIPIFPPSC